MSVCINLVRLIKAILSQEDRGCTFVEIMQIIGEQDRNLTPEDISEGDLLTAILAGVEAGLLSEKGDRVFVVKTGAKRAQNSGHVEGNVIQEEADDDICLANIKRDVTNPYTIMIDLAKPRRADKVREWLNDNESGSFEYNTDDEEILSPMKINNSSVATPESVKKMTLAPSPCSRDDIQETLPRQVLREIATKAGNRHHAKSSENLRRHKSDVRETKMGAKRMASDSKNYVQPSTKQRKFSNVSMADREASKDGRKGWFCAKASHSVPKHASYEPADQNENDLTATGFDKISIEIKMTNTAVGSRAPNEIAFQCDAKHTPLLPSLQERKMNLQGSMSAESRTKIGHKMADNNKMTGVRKTHQRVVTAVHAEHYNPLNECLKSLLLSQEELSKFDLEGVRAPSQVDNESVWFGESTNNVGYFYKYDSNSDELGDQLDTLKAEDASQDHCDDEKR